MLTRLGQMYAAQWRALRGLRPSFLSLMARIILSALTSFIALRVAVWITSVQDADGATVIAAVIVMGVADVLVRPLLLAIALPLGLIAVALVGLIFRTVAFLVILPLVGIGIDSFWAGLLAALIYSAVQTVLSGLLHLSDDDSFSARTVAQVIRDAERLPDTDVPGVVFIQIDGLAAPLLAAQVRAGNLPVLSRWLRSGSHRMVEWTPLVPSQTSASQAGILLGSNDGIPAFRWYEKSARKLMVSNHVNDAQEIERRLSTGDGLLADGGASIDNLFSGDAPINRMTMSKVNSGDRTGATRSLYYFVMNPYSVGRMLVRTLGEAIKEVFQARQQRRRGIEPRMHRGGTYPFLRAATNVVLWDVNIAMVTEQMLRGTPSIYVDFLGYDEIAHHSGPERIEALHALEGIDRAIGRLERLRDQCPRPYRFVVLSDHGQSLGATFRQRYGETLEEWLRSRLNVDSVRTATESTEEWGQMSAMLTEVSAADGVVPSITRRALRNRTHDGVVELGPMAEARDDEAADGLPDLVVCASGNLGLVYFGIAEGRLTLEEIDAAYPGLVNELAEHRGVGFVLVRSQGAGSVVIGRKGRRRLDDGSVTGVDPLIPFGPDAVQHVTRLDGIEHVGDLAVISSVDPGTGEVAAFEELIGSHGGLGGWQTRAVVVHPSTWREPPGRIIGAPALHDQLKAWLAEVQVPAEEPAS